ncbi:MAG TPA: DMT family transporter [Terriglobales bacterium]|nr:DMT family transporter [Terriglobales bacterium]
MRTKTMWTLLLLAALGGAAIALQALVNARLQQSAGNPVLAATISFAVGLVGLLIVLAPTHTSGAQTLSQAPWWAWIGGLLGAFYIVMSILLIPRIGAAALISSTVLGQMVFAIIADHYGFMGTPVREASPLRLLGGALLIAGVFLIRGR